MANQPAITCAPVHSEMGHALDTAGQPRGLMAFCADITLTHQPAYQRWHNNEHIPERLAIPGFVRGRRYRSVKNSSRFLMYYDTVDLEVLTSDAYLARLNAPTLRTSTALKWFENGSRTAYELMASCGAVEKAAPPIIASLRYALPGSAANITKWPHWNNGESLRQLAEQLGLERVLAYQLNEEGSQVSTGEAHVHKAEPSNVGGLLMLHSQNLELLDDSNAWQSLSLMVSEWAKSNALVGEIDADIYSLEFALESDSKASDRGRL